tara:strand:- start:1062 stop:1406 length:345 start_codon:yes stop_codon:yes gene_type:complete
MESNIAQIMVIEKEINEKNKVVEEKIKGIEEDIKEREKMEQEIVKLKRRVYHSNATKKGMEPWIAFYKEHNQFFTTNETTKMLSHNERKKLIGNLWKLSKQNKKNTNMKLLKNN